jgi:MerR family transcriptional regulator, thiopeptide resistance regulator
MTPLSPVSNFKCTNIYLTLILQFYKFCRIPAFPYLPANKSKTRTSRNRMHVFFHFLTKITCTLRYVIFYSRDTGKQVSANEGAAMIPFWKVGDLAELTGLTVRTLRFYDQIGLFSPSRQTDSGHRLYDASDLSRLQQIVSLKELGLSLDEIKSALDGERITPAEIVKLQMARVKEQISQQQQLLEQLQHVSKRMQGQAPLTVDDFTGLLQAMRVSHEKIVIERQKSWEHRLDALGSFLTHGLGGMNSKEE